MNKIAKIFICTFAIISLVGAFVFPAYAAEERISLNCTYCGTELSIIREYKDYTTITRTCSVVPDSAHEHYRWYLYQEQLCLDCGYSITVNDGFIEETCEFTCCRGLPSYEK